MSVSTPGYFDRKPSSAQVRPGLAHLQADPSSPLTPQRAISSAVSSPSASFRAEEEPLIFEFGTRHFSAGFAGETHPRCTLGFGPEESRRVGDYRRWLPGWEERPRKKRKVGVWGSEYELWRMDVRSLELGLVEDKIERVVREAYTKHLLLDYKSSKKLILVLPAIIPHQLLNLVLITLFRGSPAPPSITLLSPPALATAAAGCRSSLLVDIGWRETLITAVYEYREVQQWRTTRAMRWVAVEMAKLLEMWQTSPQRTKENGGKTLAVGLEQVEEIISRFAWCKSRRATESNDSDPSISIPSPFSHHQSLAMPFTEFARPVEESLLAKSDAKVCDDHEQPLDLLIYKSLLAQPADIRSFCMSRIIITGGGSHIPGLKSRLLEEVALLVEERGWDPIFGKVADERRRREKKDTNLAGEDTPKLGRDININPTDAEALLRPHLDPRIPDFVDEKFLKGQDGRSKPVVPVAGAVCGMDTLGAWAGASLLAALRIKGIVEIEKDMYLQYGLAGARKDTDVSVAPQKGFGTAMPKGVERVNWTLGAWA